MTEIPDSQVFEDHSLHAGFFDFSGIPERDLKIDLHAHCYFFCGVKNCCAVSGLTGSLIERVLPGQLVFGSQDLQNCFTSLDDKYHHEPHAQ
jgi:hypothetical protein